MDASSTPAKHKKYYGSDSLVFLVDGQLFRVSVDMLRKGEYFRDMLDSSSIGGAEQGASDENPIALESKLGVSASDLESFLDVLHARAWTGTLPKTWKSWAQALRLAAMWSFEEVKTYIIAEMQRVPEADAVDALEWLRLADQNGIQPWLLRGFKLLCCRTELVSVDESAHLGIRRLLAVSHVRERFHNPQMGCVVNACNNCRNGGRNKDWDHYHIAEPDLSLIGI